MLILEEAGAKRGGLKETKKMRDTIGSAYFFPAKQLHDSLYFSYHIFTKHIKTTTLFLPSMSISLCMITKDEEKNIESSINSVKDVVDEVIIGDTGSKDSTKELAKKLGAKIIDVKWQNDFSKARNETITHATKEWILVLDADEVVAKEDSKVIKELTEKKDVLGFYFPQINYTNNYKITGWKKAPNNQYSKDYKGFYASAIIRLFQNKKGIQFEGIVHETVDASIKKQDGKLMATTALIHHYGNADPQVITRKNQTYVEMAKHKVKELGDAQSYYELGVAYKELGKFEDALKAQQDAIKKDKKHSLAHLELGFLYERNKEFDSAIHHYVESGVEKPTATAFLGIGNCYLKKNDLDQAYKHYKRALILNPNKSSIHLNMGFIEEKRKRYGEAAKAYLTSAKLNSHNPVPFLNLGNVFAKKGELQNAISAYEEAIKLNHPKKEEIKKRLEEVKKLNQKTVNMNYSVGDDK